MLQVGVVEVMTEERLERVGDQIVDLTAPQVLEESAKPRGRMQQWTAEPFTAEPLAFHASAAHRGAGYRRLHAEAKFVAQQIDDVLSPAHRF